MRSNCDCFVCVDMLRRVCYRHVASASGGAVDFDADCVAPTLAQTPPLAQRVGPLDTMVLNAEGSVAVTVLSGGTLSGTVVVDPVEGEAVFRDLSTDAAGVWELRSTAQRASNAMRRRVPGLHLRREDVASRERDPSRADTERPCAAPLLRSIVLEARHQSQISMAR